MKLLIRPLALLVILPFLTGFEVQGHRGARGLEPENTLPAFARAMELGVSTLELDTGVTADGVVVVIHDQRLNPEHTRDAYGAWLSGDPPPAVNRLTLAELKSYDVGRVKPGSRAARRFPDQKARDGARIPTLDEVFALVQASGNTDVRFNIETKLNPENPGLSPAPEPFAEALLAAIEAGRMRGRVTIQSFDWRTLQAVQRLAPNIPTVYLTARQSWLDNLTPLADGRSPWTAGFELADYGGSIPRLIKAAGGAVWSPFHKEVDRAQIIEAHALGLQVIVWTVNKDARMKELIAIGVDGIITDYPDRLVRAAKEAGLVGE